VNRSTVDVVGVGANSVDYVYRLPQFPRPDSPAAKLRITAHLVACGGQTATALCTCAAMGLRTAYVGATGSDPNGERIRGELAGRGVDVAHVRVREAINPFAVILLDERQGERVVLWDRSAALALRPDEIDAPLIRRARLVHVDDVDEEAAIGAARLAREAGVPVTSDIEAVTARTEELVATVTIPIFAEHVPAALTGERDLERALRTIQRVRLKPDAARADLVCVTRGARGAMLLAGDRLYHEPGLPIAAVDTTGAGDVFRGAFIVALLRGDPPDAVLRFANAAAALSCTRLGAIASVPGLEETTALVSRL
jgi:sugar/nucleoside kinase (ribokinase family)